MAEDSENQTPAEEPASETPKAEATKAKATAPEGQPAELWPKLLRQQKPLPSNQAKLQ